MNLDLCSQVVWPWASLFTRLCLCEGLVRWSMRALYLIAFL